MITMNEYESCFKAFSGEQGKRTQPNYCIEGYRFNSKTDERQDMNRYQDWFTWNGGCSELIPRKRRKRCSPKREQLA